MSGLEVAHLLGVDSLPKNTLLEPPIQKGKNKEKQQQLYTGFEWKAWEKPRLKLKMLSNS